jgi:hypothetical protein
MLNPHQIPRPSREVSKPFESGPAHCALNDAGAALGVQHREGADNTHNADRILRTPGRTNSKGDNSPLCEVVSDDGPEYEPSDFNSM